MCGRFTLRTPSNLLVQQFLLPIDPQWHPRYNIAPTQPIAVVRLSEDGAGREGVQLRWGLVPSWAKDAKIGSRMINARAETVAEKPSFRSAFKRRRCLVPADGYYEWLKTGGGKQPYFIRLLDERPFAFAGLWEYWEGSGEGPLQTCTIITTTANERTADIHLRMPVILDEQDYEPWLDADQQDRRRLEPLLKPYDSSKMTLDPVSKYVNNVCHESPECIKIQRELF
jgi:putative SOS response-associated peptidase YedK